MESIKEINQIIAPVIIEETATAESIKSFNIETIDDTNNKARQIMAPGGNILVSYSSKVELITTANINGELQEVEFISKLYNAYSTTTSRHQHAFRRENYCRDAVKIYLPDKAAQQLFDAAVTNYEAAERIKTAAVNQYLQESRTLELLKSNPDLQELQAAAEFINAADYNHFKTVNKQIAKFKLNNISFEVVRSWDKKTHALKSEKIQKINPCSGSVLSD